MNCMVFGEGYLPFLNMVMNFEVLYKTHNFLTPRMTVIYAFRVLIIIKRLHSSGHTHTRDSLRVVKWVLNFLNRGPNYWVRVFVRDRRVFFLSFWGFNYANHVITYRTSLLLYMSCSRSCRSCYIVSRPHLQISFDKLTLGLIRLRVFPFPQPVIRPIAVFITLRPHNGHITQGLGLISPPTPVINEVHSVGLCVVFFFFVFRSFSAGRCLATG
jgi:hypothetical protein